MVFRYSVAITRESLVSARATIMKHNCWWSDVRSRMPSTAVTLYFIRSVPDAMLDLIETVPASLNCASDAVADVAVPVAARCVHHAYGLSARRTADVSTNTHASAINFCPVLTIAPPRAARASNAPLNTSVTRARNSEWLQHLRSGFHSFPEVCGGPVSEQRPAMGGKP